MKGKFSFLLFLIFFQVASSQNTEKHQFAHTSISLQQLLNDLEKTFQVKYSYIDSVLKDKTITLPKKLYTLEEIHLSIEENTDLKVTKINDRFYSIFTKNSDDSFLIYNLNEIVIESLLAKGIDKTPKSVIVNPQKIKVLPGVTDADVLLTLQQLPGVKSPNETATGLNVRGGTSDQNLILWDGIKVYHPGHLFGMISGFNPNVDQKVNFYYKGINAKYGRHLSSVIDIKTTDDISKKISVGLNGLNGDVYVKVPLIKDKLGIQVSGRKSFTEKLQTPTFNQLSNKVFQNTNFTNFDNENHFKFQDYFAKLNFKPNDKTSLSLTTLLIDNSLQFRTVDDIDANTVQKMKILNYGYSLNWDQKYGSKLTQNATFYYSVYDFDYERNRDFSNNEFDAFKKLNRIIESGADFNFRYSIQDGLNVDFGYQIAGKDVSHLFNSFNNEISVVLSLEHLYNITHASFFNVDWNVNKWNFQIGGRYNSYKHIKENIFEPRVFIQKRITDTFTWEMSYERKSQVISQIRESVFNDLSLENYVWVLSDRTNHPVQKSNQFATGFVLKDNSWLLDFGLYYKTVSDITSISFGFRNQFDDNIRRGDGFTKGIDFLLQKRTKTWRAWLTYTYQDSQNRFDEINNGDYFSINTNIKHHVNISFNKDWNNYSLALGWFWHSGKPYSVINESGDVTSFNSRILPHYHRLDISGLYQFKDRLERNYKIGFSIYNAYNRKSLTSKEFERRYPSFESFSTPEYTLQRYNSLQITPNIFFRVDF